MRSKKLPTVAFLAYYPGTRDAIPSLQLAATDLCVSGAHIYIPGMESFGHVELDLSLLFVRDIY